MFSLALATSIGLFVPSAMSVDDSVTLRLVAALSDPDPEVRHNLAIGLAKIGSGAVEPLIRALSDSSAVKRAGAAYALGQIGQRARASLPALLELLKDPELAVRQQASYAISKILPTGPRRDASSPQSSVTGNGSVP